MPEKGTARTALMGSHSRKKPNLSHPLVVLFFLSNTPTEETRIMHIRTIACAQKAELLMADGSEDSLRYATLQFRMGIEHVFY